ncbi:MAG: hypothetical protein OEY70_01910 [Acidimicrobiia bacterium]|nr:hypothetical protein [Acidimicrobiia bacterium]
MTEPTSADPDALGRFVDTSRTARGELSERTAELDGLVRWVEAGTVDFGVPGMASLVERLAALGIQWELSESGVAAVGDALMGADVGTGPLPVVFNVASLVDQGQDRVADALAADLVGAGMTTSLAALIATETVGLVDAHPTLTVYEARRLATATATGVPGPSSTGGPGPSAWHGAPWRRRCSDTGMKRSGPATATAMGSRWPACGPWPTTSGLRSIWGMRPTGWRPIRACSTTSTVLLARKG